ncbi:hypothetical protein [Alteromonas macleodii]|jgi:hypothetical protein|tara:strand:- start:97 stop:1053 length:957 start_codon:yes stop_codon:yes gene_type:complete
MMGNKSIHFRSRAFISCITLALVASLQIVAFIAQFLSHQSSLHQAVDNVQKRIGLDSAFLDVGNKTLNTPVNQFAISQYLGRLNDTLKQEGYPVLVERIQGVTLDSEDFRSYPNVITVNFVNAEQEINVNLRSKSASSFLTFNWSGFIISLFIAPLFFVSNRTRKRRDAIEEIAPASPKLVINLKDKTISNGIDEKAVTLQNKPLCFYTALVRYCIDNPLEPLPPHKDVPQELITLANKCFGRLIELGHTKRKRPDFNANLDKTLSEIRAALDEVFSAYNVEKEAYYPPRAQGEGSRSKQHSYALPPIKEEDIEIIGN